MHDVFVEQQPDRIVMEICSMAGWIHDLACGLGFEVQVANTNGQAWQWNNVKRKTDRDDALKLAKLSAMEQLALVHIPKSDVREKRSLINYRHGLVQRQTTIKNSIRDILTRQGIAMLPGKQGWSKTSLGQLNKMALPFAKVKMSQLWRGQLWLELQQYENIVETIGHVEKKLEALNKKDKQVKLLQTVPGVGARLAETVAAYLDKPERFETGKQVGCYAGLTPRQYQSGNMNRQGRISGQGNKLLRSLLVEVCWLGLRWNAWMRQTYERIMRGSKSRKKIAITALARKLLVRLWAMLRDGVPWREPTLQETV
jgi:transposase